jgi:hypothetical protein
MFHDELSLVIVKANNVDELNVLRETVFEINEDIYSFSRSHINLVYSRQRISIH